MAEPTNGNPRLNHEDYCRLVGRVVIDTLLRIEFLEKQTGKVFEGFQAQTETLRQQLQAANERIAKLEQGEDVSRAEAVSELKGPMRDEITEQVKTVLERKKI